MLAARRAGEVLGRFRGLPWGALGLGGAPGLEGHPMHEPTNIPAPAAWAGRGRPLRGEAPRLATAVENTDIRQCFGAVRTASLEGCRSTLCSSRLRASGWRGRTLGFWVGSERVDRLWALTLTDAGARYWGTQGLRGSGEERQRPFSSVSCCRDGCGCAGYQGCAPTCSRLQQRASDRALSSPLPAFLECR